MSRSMSDLVRDSRIDTRFLSDTTVVHTYTTSDLGTRQRRGLREETWQKQGSLGKGNFGKVWLQRCSDGQRPDQFRAVKEVLKGHRSAVDYTRELEAIAKFSHKKYRHCFVQSYGWYEDKTSIFITMEFLELGDLEGYLKRPFPESQAQKIASQLIEGMDFMHENGFAHRDLKPQNILVVQPQPDWWVKIGDFGFSKRTVGMELTSNVGTPSYKAPELQSPDQQGSYGVAVDIWAVGQITFQMMTNRLAFSGDDAGDDLSGYYKQSRQFPETLLVLRNASPQCCEFIKSTMAASPDHRPKAKDLVRHAWLTWTGPWTDNEMSFLPATPNPLQDQDSVHTDPSTSWSYVDEPPGTSTLCRQYDLHRASRNGHVEVVKALLEKGAGVMVASKNGWRPLHWASRNGHVEVVKALLEKGAGVAVITNDGRTPLHLASQNGHVEVVQALLERGANIMVADNDGATPLHRALQEGYVEVVKALLEKGAGVMVADRNGWALLHWASQNGYVKIVKALLEKGAGVMVASKNGRTPLHLASRNGYVEVVKALLQKGADVMVADKDGWTPLHLASHNGHLEVIQALLEKGAGVMVASKNGWTPLQLASQNGHVEVVQALLEKGADVAVIFNDGWTPLHWASQNGYIEVVKALLQRGANVAVITSNGWTPLHLASQNGHVEVVKAILEKGADVAVITNDGWTPLHLASQNGHVEVVKAILEKGADVAVITNDGWTPLHLASLNGHVEVVQALLEKGAGVMAAGLPFFPSWVWQPIQRTWGHSEQQYR